MRQLRMFFFHFRPMCSVHQDVARANLRGARHERRTVAGGREQAGRTVAVRRLRDQVQGHREPRPEALEMRLRRVQCQIQLSRGAGARYTLFIYQSARPVNLHLIPIKNNLTLLEF